MSAAPVTAPDQSGPAPCPTRARHLTVVRDAPTPDPAPRRVSPDLFPVALVGMVGATGAAGILTYLIGGPALAALVVVVALLVLAHAVTAKGDRHKGPWGR